MRLRTMILAVAVAAVILAVVARESRRIRLRSLAGLAESNAKLESYWKLQESAMRRMEAQELAAENRPAAAIHAAQSLYDREQARYYGTLRRKYENAVQKGGRYAEPDPPPSRLYPADYLSKVPYYSSNKGTQAGADK